MADGYIPKYLLFENRKKMNRLMYTIQRHLTQIQYTLLYRPIYYITETNKQKVTMSYKNRSLFYPVGLLCLPSQKHFLFHK